MQGIRERILSRSFVDSESDCWIWSGRTYQGYGRIKVNNRDRSTHRLIWEAWHGPVPEGLELDHLCRQRACCNPDHLEPVTHAENVRRGAQGVLHTPKTHCRHGHEFTEENTRVGKSGARFCRMCDRLRHRKK